MSDFHRNPVPIPVYLYMHEYTYIITSTINYLVQHNHQQQLKSNTIH